MRTMFVEKWLVGLTQADAELRASVALEGEPATQTLRRGLAALAELAAAEMREPREIEPRDHVVRYRKPPLCPDWLTGTRMTLTRASAQADQLASRRWEVELCQVEAAVDLPPEEEDLVLDRQLFEGDD